MTFLETFSMNTADDQTPARRSRSIFAFFVLLFLAFAASSQEPSTSPTPDDPDRPVKVKTDLVTLTLTVTDQYGRYVSGLNKNAFTIQDNNQEQDIQFFSDSDAPVSVGIVFDVSGSMSGEKILKARQ